MFNKSGAMFQQGKAEHRQTVPKSTLQSRLNDINQKKASISSAIPPRHNPSDKQFYRTRPDALLRLRQYDRSGNFPRKDLNELKRTNSQIANPKKSESLLNKGMGRTTMHSQSPAPSKPRPTENGHRGMVLPRSSQKIEQNKSGPIKISFDEFKKYNNSAKSIVSRVKIDLPMQQQVSNAHRPEQHYNYKQNKHEKPKQFEFSPLHKRPSYQAHPKGPAPYMASRTARRMQLQFQGYQDKPIERGYYDRYNLTNRRYLQRQKYLETRNSYLKTGMRPAMQILSKDFPPYGIFDRPVMQQRKGSYNNLLPPGRY